MSDLKSKILEEKEYRRRFISAIAVYGKNKNSLDPKRRELSEYAANIVADGFIKYSNDKVGEIILDVIRSKVLEDDYLVKKIIEKAKEAGVKISLGKNIKKYNLDKNESKGMSFVIAK